MQLAQFLIRMDNHSLSLYRELQTSDTSVRIETASKVSLTGRPAREVFRRLGSSTDILDVELARGALDDVLDGVIAEMACELVAVSNNTAQLTALERLALKENAIRGVNGLCHQRVPWEYVKCLHSPARDGSTSTR
jgi:hypothetical protein